MASAAGVVPADEGADEGPRPLEGVTVVITGTLASLQPRRRAEAVQERGGKVTGQRVEEDHFVVVGAEPGASKYDKAVEVRVPVLDDAGFAVLLEDGPEAAPGARAPPELSRTSRDTAGPT